MRCIEKEPQLNQTEQRYTAATHIIQFWHFSSLFYSAWTFVRMGFISVFVFVFAFQINCQSAFSSFIMPAHFRFCFAWICCSIDYSDFTYVERIIYIFLRRHFYATHSSHFITVNQNINRKQMEWDLRESGRDREGKVWMLVGFFYRQSKVTTMYSLCCIFSFFYRIIFINGMNS